MVGFLATCRPDDSRQFYKDSLGLTLVEETPFALVFSAFNALIRVQKTDQVMPLPYTCLGWEVEVIEDTVQVLSDAGIVLERFNGLQQDDLGIWTVPDGSRVAWFKDPDGNLLSLTQHA